MVIIFIVVTIILVILKMIVTIIIVIIVILLALLLFIMFVIIVVVPICLDSIWGRSSPSNSRHQDYYMFSPQKNLHLPLLLGG